MIGVFIALAMCYRYVFGVASITEQQAAMLFIAVMLEVMAEGVLVITMMNRRESKKGVRS